MFSYLSESKDILRELAAAGGQVPSPESEVAASGRTGTEDGHCKYSNVVQKSDGGAASNRNAEVVRLS